MYKFILGMSAFVMLLSYLYYIDDKPNGGVNQNF